MDFIEPARPFALELVGGRGHYERVVRAAMEARRSVWIATANLKELMVEDHRAVPGRRRTARVSARSAAAGAYRSILEVFDELAKPARGLLHQRDEAAVVVPRVTQRGHFPLERSHDP